MPNRRTACWKALAALAFSLAANATTLEVRYPKQESAEAYPVRVLELALQKSGVAFQVAPLSYQMPQGRALMELAKNSDLNVVWSITSKEREQELLPVRIPIDKGLYGWRLLLVNERDLSKFAGLQSLQALKQLKAGQGHDWPDTTILRSNGLPVEVSTHYDALFRMLKASRFDYFPRSVLEIWSEAAQHSSTGLAVEPSLLIRYPAALYFFVNKSRPELAATLERGLNAAIKDGSFEKLFQATYGDAIQRAHLSRRTQLRLENPLLPPTLPLSRKELWVQ